MAIKRYFADKNNTITNAFRSDLTTRGTGSNMGKSDILETFSIYGQATSSSVELERVLIQFPTADIATDRTAGTVPASGNVEFYLKLYNAKHNSTLPSDYSLEISAVSASWQEGVGTDMEEYKDLTYDKLGSNWIKRSGSTSWASEGGDYHATPTYTNTFTIGNEDLEIEVTPLVEEWLAATKTDYGFAIKLPTALEAQDISYYTKKFFGKGTSNWFKKPVLEARWDSTVKDDRGNFYTSSSLAGDLDNLNTIYLYNFVRGQLKNIPAIGTGEIYVDLYSTLGGTAETQCVNTPVTGGWHDTGIYTASVCLESTESVFYDVWHSSGVQYHTGSIASQNFAASNYSTTKKYTFSITNSQEEYYPEQSARFRFFARQKGWNPDVYTVAQSTVSNLIFESASYQITRVVDDYIVVNYGTGSVDHTLLSYDVSGNYFDFDMSMLEPGYMYAIHLSIYDDAVSSYIEQTTDFKFKVNKYDY